LLVGCHATVSLQSVTGVSASDLQRAELCIRADALTAVAGSAPELKPGHPACWNAGEESTFFYASPNGGGGSFGVNPAG
jgi:hypothetical protein